jgi:hypothetical protein
MVTTPKIAAFVLCKTLDGLQQSALTLGHMRKAIAVTGKISSNEDMKAFVLELGFLAEPAEKEKYASEHGYETLEIDLSDEDKTFLAEIFTSVILPAFNPNLDKRVVVAIADAIGIQE